MLPKDILIVDLGADNWNRLLGLGKGLLEALPPGEGPGPLLVIYRGLKLLKAIDLGRGRAVNVEFYGTSRLDMLSRESGYPRVLALEENAVARVVGHAQRELEYGDDYFKQLGNFARGVAREWGRTIFTYPPRGRPLVPSHRAFEGVFRLLVPDDTVLLFVVTEKGKAWTSAVLGYSGGDLWLLTSLDTIALEEGDLSEGALGAAADLLRSKYGGTVRVVAVEREALRRVSRSRFPAGTLLWALNTGDLRISRVPWRWKVLAFAAALARARRR
ncbi:MAG: hypothetical protein L6427_10585 [Actinomycetia bacterium]|nr:hypothetical protein [Actinomycetota bacterium]MCG2796288.1 hypothetical protein [Actinomycetes bacterium]